MNNTPDKFKLREDICELYLARLRTADGQLFFGYHFSVDDYLKMVVAVKYFQDMKDDLREKLIKEGVL